jgi:hypothetical protein
MIEFPEHLRKIMQGDCEGCERRRERLKAMVERINAEFRKLGPPNLALVQKIMRDMLTVAASPESEIEQSASMNIAKNKPDH